MKRVFTIADLSCGAGLASRGVIDGLQAFGLKCRVLTAVDPWGPAVNSYAANVPEAVRGAVMQTTTEEALARGLVPKVDLVITGPPCIRDSTLTKCKLGVVTDRSAEMAEIKYAAREIGAAQGRLVAMETVGLTWIPWGNMLGFRSVRLQDSALGGFTVRRRTFLLSPQINPQPTSSSAYPRRGWGDALPRWKKKSHGKWKYLLLNDADKRQKHTLARARPPSKPGFSVVGHGTAPGLVFTRHPFKRVYRLRPEDGAKLQGFPGLVLDAPKVRDRQTLVGNGWPRSFGLWLAASIVASSRG